VTTQLERNRTWELLSDIENWPKFSDTLSDLRWTGPPWSPGSCIVGMMTSPLHMPIRYVLEECDPPLRISYLAHSMNAGFATHRTVELQQLRNGTQVTITAYMIGNAPTGGDQWKFLRLLTEEWYQGFASFCDAHLVRG
jgi:hypothetical protein